VGKSEGKSHLDDLTVDGNFMSNWILKNTDRVNVDWIHLAQEKKLPTFVSMVMTVQFPQHVGDFLTS